MRLWQGRRRREDQIRQAQATADAERALLRRQLDELLRICASVGAEVNSLAADAVRGIPVGLMAASSVTYRPGGYPVRLDLSDGREAIAIIEGMGSAALWWDEIQARAGHATPGVFGIDHRHLSPGLSAIATRNNGAITLIVSTTLSASAQRAAVVTALRAAKRAGWTTRPVPVLLFPLALPGVLYTARRLLEHVRWPHLAAAATATGAATTLAVALLAVPAHRPARAIPPVAAAPSPQHVRRARQVAKPPGRKRKPQQAPVPTPAPSVLAVSQTPQPTPSTSSTPGASPSPSTSPAPDPCIPLLLVCVDIA